MKRILEVRIVREPDSDPDTSWIGEYASQPGPEDRTIDRQERGDCGHGEYRYFVAANSGEETGNPDSVEQDYQRMESLNAQQWGFMGISAVADVQLTASGVIQHISSGGLWGIESDSDAAYFQEVESGQLAGLRRELLSLGFSARTIKRAFTDAKQVA